MSGLLKLGKPSNQRGDTIIEVMIVLTILGFAIGVSLATSNRSLQNARQAQEHSESTRIVQTQAEGLRVLAPVDPAPAEKNIFVNTPFCIKYDAGNFTVVGDTDPACTGGSAGYKTSVQYCRGSGAAQCTGLSSTNTFIIQVSWDNVQGRGSDSTTLAYRVHKP